MSLSRLWFWYTGARKLRDREITLQAQMMGAKVAGTNDTDNI